jgi:hypothetical protein
VGRTHEVIDERLRRFLEAQPVFFVATAPLSPGGHVNCSPKSNNGELTVLGASEVAYLDRTGSGIETVAHLRENGRIVLMFCAFTGRPRIVRLHGRATVVARDEAGFSELARRFRPRSVAGSRSVVCIEVSRIADSCGYGVPLMDFAGHRPDADAWHARKGEGGIRAYWAEKNAASLDGLPGVPEAVTTTAPSGEPQQGNPATAR